ncbi:MAG: hypothetical protein E7321_02865 [Clostridiales bacterium]|nr:hypothetical protein [Clostridiales bacterium]
MNRDGVWLKGNLHIHTQKSDGKMPFDEAVRLYEQAGYDFISVTDHWIVSEKDQTPGGMLLLSGCEYNIGKSVRDGIFHVVGVGMERAPQIERWNKSLTVQMLIDGIRACGGLAILAHPAWSLNRPEQVIGLEGLSGVEIYNATSGFPHNCRPYSGQIVDQLASLGKLLPCMAADDVHEYKDDLFGGYLMVHAKEKTHEAIKEALACGDFYATQGPKACLSVEDGVATVTCSPATHVVFYSDSVWSDDRVTIGQGITTATCRLMKNETFVRAEVIDSEGKTAYTSPVRVR